MAATPRFAAALFDVDGTLLDSTEFVVGAIEHVLQSRNRVPPPRSVIARSLGPPLPDCYRQLAPDLDPVPLCAEHRAWQLQRRHLVKPFPHAATVLRALREAGVRLAAVTARSRISSLGTLADAGLDGLLEFTISAEDVARMKPDPEALLVALHRLNVTPARAVMIGDTTADILAGKAAGVTTMGVLYGFHGAGLAQVNPDFLVRDIRELPPLILDRRPSSP
jgi:HAD superfamily hydrolase (TIGR01509 family)